MEHPRPAAEIDGMLYERAALSKKPEKLIRTEFAALRTTDCLTPELVLRDPYLLDFLGLHDTLSERDLESALLREIERSCSNSVPGSPSSSGRSGSHSMATIYDIDLPFFHRRLRRFVVIADKIGDFKPADSGQLGLYLRWLDRHEQRPGEDARIAIILCAGRKRETVEYLDLDRSGIHVAEYLTELSPREVLQKRFHEALAPARARVDRRESSAVSRGGVAVPCHSGPRGSRRRLL